MTSETSSNMQGVHLPATAVPVCGSKGEAGFKIHLARECPKWHCTPRYIPLDKDKWEGFFL